VNVRGCCTLNGIQFAEHKETHNDLQKSHAYIAERISVSVSDCLQMTTLTEQYVRSMVHVHASHRHPLPPLYWKLAKQIQVNMEIIMSPHFLESPLRGGVAGLADIACVLGPLSVPPADNDKQRCLGRPSA